jgi:hypothetical protein
VTAGEVEGDGVKAVTDPTADLDQTQPKGRKLQMGDVQASQPAANGVQEPVGAGVEEQAELIGPEPMATEPISEATLLEVLDAEFGMVTALGIPVVGVLRGVIAGGNVPARRTAVMSCPVSPSKTTSG